MGLLIQDQRRYRRPLHPQLSSSSGYTREDDRDSTTGRDEAQQGVGSRTDTISASLNVSAPASGDPESCVSCVSFDEGPSDPYESSPNSKYPRYDLPVDHKAGDRALKIKIFSAKRPHMRSLHCAWFSFFLAFTIWFAPAPLLKEIGDTLGLNKQQLWMSSIANDIMAIIGRVIIGPFVDAHAARIPMAVVLCVASIPTAMLGLVQSGVGLSILRLFIGIAGTSFVMSQFWPSRMFAREIAGTANGIVGGWGNLGGAFTQILMGRILFPAFRDYYGSSEAAWRTIAVIPAAITFAWGCILPFLTDDAPMGNYSEMRRNGTIDRVFYTTSLRSGAKLNTLILYIQYACSFGVEIVMNNGTVLYFNDQFGLSTEDGATLAFTYGAFNIFARAMGGGASDWLNIKSGMRGRLWLTTILLLFEGILLVVFAFVPSLGGAIATMCVFSLFTQSAEGAIYGVVPYISKMYTGSVAGWVGSGGNVGSLVFGLGFRSLEYRQAFLMTGSIVVGSSFLSLFVKIPCHAGLITGEDNNTVIQARERFLRRRELQQALLVRHPEDVDSRATQGSEAVGVRESGGDEESPSSANVERVDQETPQRDHLTDGARNVARVDVTGADDSETGTEDVIPVSNE